MISESIAAIPGQDERVVSLITKKKLHLIKSLSHYQCLNACILHVMFYHKESTQRSWVVPCEIDL